MKILFLDFDGVMIPTRAYWIDGQTRPVSKFDPCAVSLVNKLCEENDIKIVVVSSWRRTVFAPYTDDLKLHMISQGIKEHLIHEDSLCPFKFSSSKYHDVTLWLENHPEVVEYLIVDDDLHDLYGHKGKIITPIFDDGFDMSIYKKAANHFGQTSGIIF